MVCMGRSIERVCVWVGRGSVFWGVQYFWDAPSILSNEWIVNEKKKSTDPEKKVRGERERERDVRVKLIPVDPFGMPSFFLWLSYESSLTSSINAVQPPFTHTQNTEDESTCSGFGRLNTILCLIVMWWPVNNSFYSSIFLKLINLS